MRHPVKTPVQAKQLRPGQPLIKSKVFRKKTDLATSWHVPAGLPENSRFARGGLHQPEKHFDRRALARPIRPEKAKNLATRDIEREVANGNLIAKNLPQSTRTNGKITGRWHHRALGPFLDGDNLAQRRGQCQSIIHRSISVERVDDAILGPQQAIPVLLLLHLDERALDSVHEDWPV